MTLTPDCDPMGRAIADYFETGRTQGPLIVQSPMFDDDEMPVSDLFRTEAQMPVVERHALSLCSGRVLDVGAGAGCHSLALQQRGMQCTAIDISQLSVETMRRRGVADARCADFFTDDFGRGFHTLLLLMNGLGIAGRLNRLPALLNRCKQLLAPDGVVLADSSDLRYIFEDESGQLDWDPANGYYGEVDYRMRYAGCTGRPFRWLYVDFDTLSSVATRCGMTAVCVHRGEHYDYLAKIVRS